MSFFNRTHIFLVILLLCCWGCDTPLSVLDPLLPNPESDTAELPGSEEMPVVTEPSDAVPTVTDVTMLSDVEALIADDGEILSPIPDDIYELLWGSWTQAGVTSPRRYYTKYLDAGGIAIVGDDLAPDNALQVARDIILVMTSKIPALREALAPETGFRFMVIHDRRDAPDLGVTQEGSLINLGWCGGHDCGISVKQWEDFNSSNAKVMMHEMVHAIHGALIDNPHLRPGFIERLDALYRRDWVNSIHWINWRRKHFPDEPYGAEYTAEMKAELERLIDVGFYYADREEFENTPLPDDYTPQWYKSDPGSRGEGRMVPDAPLDYQSCSGVGLIGSQDVFEWWAVYVSRRFLEDDFLPRSPGNEWDAFNPLHRCAELATLTSEIFPTVSLELLLLHQHKTAWGY